LCVAKVKYGANKGGKILKREIAHAAKAILFFAVIIGVLSLIAQLCSHLPMHHTITDDQERDES